MPPGRRGIVVSFHARALDVTAILDVTSTASCCDVPYVVGVKGV